MPSGYDELKYIDDLKKEIELLKKRRKKLKHITKVYKKGKVTVYINGKEVKEFTESYWI